MSPDDEEKNIIILHQMGKVYERELDLKKNLENKAVNVITVSGFMITLLFGFSTFLFQRSIQIEWINYCYILIFGSIILAIIALWYSLRSLKITEISFVLSENRKDKVRLQDIIERYWAFDKDKLIKRLTYSYMSGIKDNSWYNEDIASYIRKSQISLFVALLLIATVIGLTTIPVIINIFQ